jgi:hypothetical protein
MKRLLSSSLSILLAVTILVTGTAFTVKKMVCLVSGKVNIGLYDVKGCCGKEDERSKSDEQEISSKCCTYSSESFHLEHRGLVKEFLLKKADLISGDPVPVYSLYIPKVFFSRTVHSFADLPPPLSGRERLNLISILTI